MIKAVFVDLGGVLVLNKASEVYKEFEEKYGLTGDAIKDIFSFLHSGIRSVEDLQNHLSDKNISLEIWREFTSKFYNSEKRNDALVDILQSVKNKNVKIIYTSNNSSSLYKVLEKYSLSELPDHIVNSSLINVTKPDREFWEAAYIEAEKLIPNIQKSEILVIDDSKTNCDSAIDFGLKSIQYNESVNNRVIAATDIGQIE